MNKQMRLARLWDGERRIMVKQQYANPEEHASRFRSLVRHLGVDGPWLNAAVGTGTPALVGMDAGRDGKKLLLSDGDNDFLKLLHKNYHGWIAREASWHELPVHYGFRTLSAVEITGNSLPYATDWAGRGTGGMGRLDALFQTILTVGWILDKGGKFIFDLARYGEGRHEIGDGYFQEIKYDGGLRIWTVGKGKALQARTGLILDIDRMNQLLKAGGFREARLLPPEFQLDPKYYELYFAEKK